MSRSLEPILGIGDWGIGGIDIATGKLAVYSGRGNQRLESQPGSSVATPAGIDLVSEGDVHLVEVIDG